MNNIFEANFMIFFLDRWNYYFFDHSDKYDILYKVRFFICCFFFRFNEW